MNTTTAYPVTVRELGDMAEARGKTIIELLEEIGPFPTPPAGYTLAPKSETRWIGAETMARGYIVTPFWYYRTQEHSIELWTAKPKGKDAALTSAEALQLAADLTAATQALSAQARSKRTEKAPAPVIGAGAVPCPHGPL